MICPFCQKDIYGLTGFQEILAFNNFFPYLIEDCRDVLIAYARDGGPDVSYANEALKSIRKGYDAIEQAKAGGAI